MGRAEAGKNNCQDSFDQCVKQLHNFIQISEGELGDEGILGQEDAESQIGGGAPGAVSARNDRMVSLLGGPALICRRVALGEPPKEMLTLESLLGLSLY